MKRLLCILLAAGLLAGCALVLLPPARLPEALRPAAEALRREAEKIHKLLNPQPRPETDAETYEVLYAIDGDTLLLLMDGKKTTVRLIGIDAPESVHPEPENNSPEGVLAAQRLRELTDGQRVTLEYDAEKTDRFGRTLAYVYSDGTLLEDLMLSEGLARAMPLEPNTRYENHFSELELEAEKAGAGFWGTGFYKPSY